MRRFFALISLSLLLLVGGWSLAQSGFPSSSTSSFVPPPPISSTVFECKKATSPFTVCGYGSANFASATVVSKFQAAALTTSGGVSAIQVIITTPVSTGAITRMTICPSATTGATQLWSCAAAPTTITFNGGSLSVSNACGAQCTSDRIVFSMSPSTAYTFAFQFTTATTVNGANPDTNTSTPSSPATNYIAYYKSGALEANTQTRATGYVTIPQGYTDLYVYKIISVP